MVENKGDERVAFLPEGAAGDAIWRLIERARVIAKERGLSNATLSFDKSLEARADIIDAFGREYFGTGLEELDEKRKLPGWLVRYSEKGTRA